MCPKAHKRLYGVPSRGLRVSHQRVTSQSILIAQTQIRLIVEGYDPTIGIMNDKKAIRGINPGFALDTWNPCDRWSTAPCYT